MKPVAHLHVNLPRIGVMCTAEGLTVIQQESPVGQVERCRGDREPFPDILSQRQIKSRMRLQMRGYIARSVCEPRAVVHIAARNYASRQIEIEAGMQRVALVMVQKEIAGSRRREIR